MLKKILISLILGTSLFFGGFGKGNAQDQSLRIAAIVNDDVISMYDLINRIALIIISSGIQDSPQARQKLAPQILRNLIDESIKTQEAKRLGIKISNDELIQAVANIEKGNGMPAGGMQATLERAGIPYDIFLEKIESEMAWVKVLQRTQRPRIKISEEEIDEVMTSLIADQGKVEYNMSEIFLPIPSPEAEQEVSLLAGRMIQQIRAGASFEAMAKNFSQSASAAVGGQLGWIQQGEIDHELQDSLSTMQSGQVSEPIRTLAGYYLLKLNDTRKSKGLSFDDATINIQQMFIPLPQSPDLTAITKARDKAAELAKQANSCKKMEELGTKTGSPLSGNLGTLKFSQLNPTIRNTVQDLPVMQPSTPVRTKDGFIVLMVCEKDENASRTAQRDKIRQKLIDEDMETAGRRYLRNLKRTAFVDVRI